MPLIVNHFLGPVPSQWSLAVYVGNTKRDIITASLQKEGLVIISPLVLLELTDHYECQHVTIVVPFHRSVSAHPYSILHV